MNGEWTKTILLLAAAVCPLAAESQVQWVPLLKQSSLFLGIEHGFRLATEPGTREGSRGSYFKGYLNSVRNLRGWSDGDEFYVNYVGHPLQGAIAGNIWVQNDPEYRGFEFGKDPRYWRGRLRAMAFSWAYSTQFEIGPLSEASIGQIQSKPPAIGFVDHVVTPVVGTGWMLAEDWLDKHVIARLEGHMENRWGRLLLRGGLNPSRSMANILAGKVPWHRYTRGGVNERMVLRTPVPPLEHGGDAYPPRYSFTVPVNTWMFGGQACLGSSALVGYRVSRSWDLAGEVGGCKMLGFDKAHSGDTLVYMAGPQWTSRPEGRLLPRMRFLVGGHKVTEEGVAQVNAPVVAMGLGLDLGLNHVVALRVADLQYMHSWIGDPRLTDYRNGVRFSTGVVFRWGAF